MIIVTILLTLLAHVSPGAITEDSPAWNCHTMGNKVCGVDHGRPIG